MSEDQSPTFLDALIGALDQRGKGGASEELPTAVIWPDESGQFTSIIPRIRDKRPILQLGGYEMGSSQGPAYWIRCVIDGTVPDVPDEPDETPVVYMPGIARSDIRAVEDAPAPLQPLAELQYRGTTFAQTSGRDWTLSAFLESSRGGLGIGVGRDDATKQALLRAAPQLCDVDVAELRKRAPLRAAFFDELVAPNLDRDVLRWLDDPDAFRTGLGDEEWLAFRARFTDRFGLELEVGPLEVTTNLGTRGGAWESAWQRYADSPRLYPEVEGHLRKVRPKRTKESPTTFDGPWGTYPQDNEADEGELRDALVEVAGLDASEARSRIADLEQMHAERRGWVWSRLDQAPLAIALGHLSQLAIHTDAALREASLDVLVDAYTATAWQADDAAMRALGSVSTNKDRDVVEGVVRALARSWLDEGARRLQRLVLDDPSGYRPPALPEPTPGTCLVFVDGLRFDVGRRVEAALGVVGLEVSLESRMSALPTVTMTAKYAISPIASQLGPGAALSPAPADGGADLTVDKLRTMLGKHGVRVLRDQEEGDPAGTAWTEHGDIDELGHKQQRKLPGLLDQEVDLLAERVQGLLDAGWERVVIVTDHGWLFLPGGLPKVALPQSVTKDGKMRKGRTARLAEGAKVDVDTVPWHWDPSVRIAVAPGISAYTAGSVYEHGGISPQECITPVITVHRSVVIGTVTIEVEWQGLRAIAKPAGAPSDATVDIRQKAGDPESSFLTKPSALRDDGTARCLVEDESTEGTAVYVVVMDSEGKPIGQVHATVGGE